VWNKDKSSIIYKNFIKFKELLALYLKEC